VSPVVEPVVTLEKLAQLLAEGTEFDTLDFKADIDLRDRKDIVEFVKDVAAMMAMGGYIVVGADDHGQATPWPADHQQMFDESTVRSIIAKYLREPVEIAVAVHTVEGATYALVYIAPHRDGFAVMAENGEYDRRPIDRDGKQSRKRITVFHRGQVYFRNGTSSEPLRQEHVGRVLARRDAGVQEAERERSTQTIANYQRAMRGQHIAEGASAGYTWQLDEATFNDATIELLRKNDQIPIQMAMLQAAGAGLSAVNEQDLARLDTILDRITTAAAIAITVDNEAALKHALAAFATIYRTGFVSGVERTDLTNTPQHMWIAVVGRLFALGALAVRLERWPVIRQLALTPPPGRDPAFYESWLRHGPVEASRSGVLPNAENGEQRVHVISLARGHINRLPALRLDFPDDTTYNPDTEPGSDPLVDSICQFDALWCVVVYLSSDRPRPGVFYTDFGYYYARRSMPIFERLVTDDQMRDELVPGVDDEALATAILQVLEMANTRNWLRGDFQPTGRLAEFLERATKTAS
jgi:Putative DNA-binding domain